MATFGFIGIGNMGGAIAAAAAKAHDPGDMLVSARRPERAEAFAREHGMSAASNEQIARECKFIILGVKPQFMAQVLAELKPIVQGRSGCVLVTMAAGMTMQRIDELAGGGLPVIRIMPNTPARVGRGVIEYDYNDRCRREDAGEFLAVLSQAGWVSHLPERLIDAGSALSGSGPAFAAMFIEALADGAVACGLPRAAAMEYAAQTLLGTAELMLHTGDHPGAMKDAVCSPGGTTIQGVRTLEKSGFRSAVIEAVIATYEKNLSLGK